MATNNTINPRPCAAFYSIQLAGGSDPPSRSTPDGHRASQKNKRVARNERKPMVSNFMVLGHPVTSEVSLNTKI